MLRAKGCNRRACRGANRDGEDSCWPVRFGLVGTDLDAARLAAIWEGDLDRSSADPGGCSLSGSALTN
jgi:hypothetical protein